MDDVRYNLKKLDEIAQGDQGFIREMLITFVENVTAEIDNIQSFKSAENWTAIAEAAHKLASNFAYMGAPVLHALAADIERSVIKDHDLVGIEEKTNSMCRNGSLLIKQIKKDFNIMSVD